jgi:hypothetical protein
MNSGANVRIDAIELVPVSVTVADRLIIDETGTNGIVGDLRTVLVNGAPVDMATQTFDIAQRTYVSGTEEAFKIYLANIAPGEQLGRLTALLNKSTIRVYGADGTTIVYNHAESATHTALTQGMRTGWILRAYSGETLVDELTLVVAGDVLGNGEAGFTELVVALDYTVGITGDGGVPLLEREFWLAGDVNADRDVDFTDLVIMLDHSINLDTIIKSYQFRTV